MSQTTISQRPYQNSNLFSGHYLDERLELRDEWDCDDKARKAMESLQSLYELEGDLSTEYNEDALIDNWITEVLDILGFGTQAETTLPESGGYVDILLFENAETRREAASVYLDTEDTSDLFGRGVGLLEAKQWDAKFSKRFSEQRPYRNASHQIKHYLERTPETIQWGILTNGRKWRLYGTKDYETQTYYEVDLPELLERGDLDKFKYFYLFFRSEAFQETGGTTFLDEVWSESETAAQELGEDLQDNVFTALRLLGRGFVETNDLDIDPDNEDELQELKNQSLVYLYRLMFVLYAESRGLIHPENQAAVQEYEQNFSLDELRLEIHETIGEVDEGFETEYSEYSTTIWSRLQNLFRLVDEGEEDLGIPPYNGGLFNEEQNQFLSENQVNDRYLAEVIYRLSTTENGGGRYVLADYADLDTRHLGSVYEGLLEHQFRIAPEDYAAVAEDGGQVWKPATDVTVAEAVETVPEGGLYVVNDEGERKATGAYYTPDYVVTYIVEETIDPLLEEIREDLIEQGFEPGTQEYLGPYLQRVTQLKILDPAMGSGHFLTRATGYISEQVMNEVREVESEMGVAFDEQHVRREIAKECIYGVDLNEMAVELSKLSMWLETLAADRPLAFLDHHLKAGNSLVGSDVTDVLSNDSDDNNGQLTLQQALARVRQNTLEHVMEQMKELLEIDNETLEDVKSMEEIYEGIRQDPFYQRLSELTNVHTAERFDLNVPEGAYERMAQAIDDEAEWTAIREEDWFQTAQAMRDEEAFFHWELEYPEVFFNEDGQKRENAGFDVVIGNPPYVQSHHLDNSVKAYLENDYKSTIGRWDIYLPFTELAFQITSNSISYIQPTMFFRRDYGEGMRDIISKSEDINVSEIVDLSDLTIFEDATNYVGIFTAKVDNSVDDVFEVYIPATKEKLFQATKEDIKSYELNNSEFSSEPWGVIPAEVARIRESIPDDFIKLEEATQFISKGIDTSADSVFYMSAQEVEEHNIEDDVLKPLLKGEDIDRYEPPNTNRRVLFPYDGDRALSEEKLKSEYPNAWTYLQDNREQLESRTYLVESGYSWFEFWRKREEKIYTNEKILGPEIAKNNEFTIDRGKSQHYFNTKVRSIKVEDDYGLSHLELLGILNSSVIEHIYKGIAPPKRGGYRSYLTTFLSELKVPTSYSGELDELVEEILIYVENRHNLNLNLNDYLGTYSDGQTLDDVGFDQPPEGVDDSILTDTTEDREKLRVGTVDVERESPTSFEIFLTARYKPEDEDEYETDQWGYTETDPLPALTISELSETEADLIEAFVPVAVDEAGGFADFRDTATQTNSLVDRLRALTLPAVDDVRDGLESYLETKERAEELEIKIEKTNELIDEVVYELYGLSEEEIEIVEESVKG